MVEQEVGKKQGMFDRLTERILRTFSHPAPLKDENDLAEGIMPSIDRLFAEALAEVPVHELIMVLPPEARLNGLKGLSQKTRDSIPKSELWKIIDSIPESKS